MKHLFCLAILVLSACSSPKTDNALQVGSAPAAAVAATAAPVATNDPASFEGQADAVCRQARERFFQIQSVQPRDLAESADQTARIVESTMQEMKSLQALVPPDRARPLYEQYLKLRQNALAHLQEGAAAAKKDDKWGYADAQARLADESSERERVGRELGFKVCSQP